VLDVLPGIIRKFEFAYDNDGGAVRPALSVYVNVAVRDGRPCRISCAANDTGSLESGLLRGFFDLLNAHLERGATLGELAPLFRGTKFEPTCMLRIGDRAHVATSPLDAIFSWFIQRFGPSTPGVRG
jgi:hypothetical protein